MRGKVVSGLMLILLLVGMLTLVLDIKPANAEVFFFDDFEGTSLDTTKWNYELGVDCSIEVADSYVTLSSSGIIFPRVYTKTNPFPTIGDFVLEFDLTYLQVTENEFTGFWVTQGWNTNRTPPMPINCILSIHQEYIESPGLHVLLLGSEVFSSDGIDLARYVYVLEYSNGTYTLSMGGGEIGSVSSSLRPDAIRFGQLPSEPNPQGIWTSFKIDKIALSNLTEVPPSVTVGGLYIPTSRLELITPYVGLTILLAVAIATVVYVKKRKRNRD